MGLSLIVEHLAGQQTKLSTSDGPGRPHISSDKATRFGGLYSGSQDCHRVTLSGHCCAMPCRALPQFCEQNCGDLAQLGERLICIQEVRGSIPLVSTTSAGSLENGSVAQVVRAHA